MTKNVWGHRGCRGMGYPPENSLAAFQTALDAGVGGIEFDVFLSQDGVPVVFHDDTLNRLTGMPGSVTQMPLAELKKLRLIGVKGKPSKQAIPTLVEVLDLVERHKAHASLVVNVEIKDARAVPAVAEELARCIQSGWRPKNLLVSSFDMAALRHFQSLQPGVPRGVLFECGAGEVAQRIAETADIGPSTVNVPLTALSADALSAITAAGATPVVWVPDETNPKALAPLELNRLISLFKQPGFVMITDFPQEVLQILKPNRARATVSGVLAACLVVGQQEMLFRPSEPGLETLKSPADYPEIRVFGFRELSLTAADGVSFTVWERKGMRGKPHFVLFHGNRAHWGDTGTGAVDKDRRARLKFIRTLAAAGAGISAVTLRGFGNSNAAPSESGFLRDLEAVVLYLEASGMDPRSMIVAGESMGTWSATQITALLTERNEAPAWLALQNPFTSMADVGAEVISHYPLVRSLQIPLSASALDRYILKNHFYTAKLMDKLQPQTAVHIATSGKDGLVPPAHSDKLAEILKSHNLRVVRDLFAKAQHSTIPPIEYALRLLALGGEAGFHSSESAGLWGEPGPSLGPLSHLW